MIRGAATAEANLEEARGRQEHLNLCGSAAEELMKMVVAECDARELRAQRRDAPGGSLSASP